MKKRITRVICKTSTLFLRFFSLNLKIIATALLCSEWPVKDAVSSPYYPLPTANNSSELTLATELMDGKRVKKTEKKISKGI
jgi:hypothetical protein